MNDKELQSNKRLSWFERLRKRLTPKPQSRDELNWVIDEAKDRALIDQEASQMIRGVMSVNEKTVSDSMVQRPQMIMIESDMTVAAALPIIIDSSHSRFPVFDHSTDKIIGILLAKDLLQLLDQNFADTAITSLIRPATFVPDSKRLNVLLKEFRLQHNHMAIVIDEYGNIDGLITIEDVLEQIVGDIEDEYDADDEEEATHIKQVEPRIAEVNALTPIAEFNDYFDKTFSEEEFDTIGGIVLRAFSHLPKVGETVEIEDLEITILDASARGIRRLRIYRNPPKET